MVSGWGDFASLLLLLLVLAAISGNWLFCYILVSYVHFTIQKRKDCVSLTEEGIFPSYLSFLPHLYRLRLFPYGRFFPFANGLLTGWGRDFRGVSHNVMHGPLASVCMP